MRIGEVAERAGIAASTLRYYEEIGLIPPPRRRSGQRDYDETIFKILAAIQLAQESGFRLEEIRQLMDGFEGGAPLSESWQSFAERKIAELDTVIQRYRAMKRLLLQGMDCGCLDLDDCAMVQAQLRGEVEAMPPR